MNENKEIYLVGVSFTKDYYTDHEELMDEGSVSDVIKGTILSVEEFSDDFFNFLEYQGQDVDIITSVPVTFKEANEEAEILENYFGSWGTIYLFNAETEQYTLYVK